VRIGEQDEPPGRIDHTRPNCVALAGVRRQPEQPDLRVLAGEAEDETARADAAPDVDHQDLDGADSLAEIADDLAERRLQPGLLVERRNDDGNVGSHVDPPRLQSAGGRASVMPGAAAPGVLRVWGRRVVPTGGSIAADAPHL